MIGGMPFLMRSLRLVLEIGVVLYFVWRLNVNECVREAEKIIWNLYNIRVAINVDTATTRYVTQWARSEEAYLGRELVFFINEDEHAADTLSELSAEQRMEKEE